MCEVCWQSVEGSSRLRVGKKKEIVDYPYYTRKGGHNYATRSVYITVAYNVKMCVCVCVRV